MDILDEIDEKIAFRTVWERDALRENTEILHAHGEDHLVLVEKKKD